MSILGPDDWSGTDEPSLHALVELLPTLVNEDPLVVATRLRDQYGQTVRVPPLHPALDSDVYLVSNPEDIRFMLQTDPSRFRALDVPGSRDFGSVVRNSIVSLHDEEEWTERLRLVSPEFSERVSQQHVPRLANTTLATLAELTTGPGQITSGDPSTVPEGARVWTESEGVRLLPAMRRLTLRLLGDSLFGPDIRAHEVAIIEAVDTLRAEFKRRQLHLVTSYVTRHLPDKLRLPSWIYEPLGADPYIELPSRHERRIEEAIEALSSAASAVVARRERTPLVFDDALGRWLRRPDPVTGEHISPGALRQEVMGLLIAGHATMSAGLTWAFYLLGSRPGVQERIHRETRDTALLAGPEALLADDPPNSPDAACHPVNGTDFLDAIPYTEQVWKEALRLYPPLPIFGRTTREPVELSEVTVEEGGHVLTSPYVTHRDPTLWEDPETFDPSRFAPGADERHPFAYYPFSGGRHSCLGEAMAMTEAKVVLASTLATHRVEFTGTDGAHVAPEVGIDSAINLQPDRDITVRFVPRI